MKTFTFKQTEQQAAGEVRNLLWHARSLHTEKANLCDAILVQENINNLIDLQFFE